VPATAATAWHGRCTEKKQNEKKRYRAETRRGRTLGTMGTCSTRFKEHPMKPWIKRSLFGVFGATVLLGGMAACANNRFEHGPMSTERMAQMRGKVIERVSGKLDLTPAQQQKLGVLADTLQAQRLAMMGSTPEPRTAMQALIAGDKFDRSGAQALLSEKTQAVNTGSPAVIAALGDFYDSLNATQQQQVREMAQRRHGGGWFNRG
jgi:protein CpxP